MVIGSDLSSWKISGAVRNGDELVFTDLLTSNFEFLTCYSSGCEKPRDFPVDSITAYKIYRFTTLAFTGDANAQRSVVCRFQIFTYFKDGD